VRRLFTLRPIAAALAILASQALLAAAFAMVRRGEGLAAAAACALGWLTVLVVAAPAASLCLTASLALAVLAVLAGAPGWLSTAATAASLVAWDLTHLATEPARGVDDAAERRMMGSHLRALGAGILPGVALAGVLGQARLTVPFPVMVGVVILALVALHRAGRQAG